MLDPVGVPVPPAKALYPRVDGAEADRCVRAVIGPGREQDL